MVGRLEVFSPTLCTSPSGAAADTSTVNMWAEHFVQGLAELLLLGSTSDVLTSACAEA